MEITPVKTFDENKIPVEGNPSFRANAGYVWTQMNPVLFSMNVAIEQMNSSNGIISGYYNDTKIYYEQSQGYRDECLVYRNDALSAKNFIESYVIPTEATLSASAIQALVKQESAKVRFNAFGYTKDIAKSKRFVETDTPNVLVDAGQDAIRFSSGLVDRNEDKNIHFPNAPFSDSSDELLDYSVNGVTTQQDHKKGDIVHCGNGQELVTNSTFDSDVVEYVDDSTGNGSVTIANNRLEIYREDIDNKGIAIFNNLGLNVDFRYLLKFSVTNANIQFYIGITKLINSDLGDFQFIIDGSSSFKFYGIVDDATAYIDNISVTPIEQTYQCIEDSATNELVTSDSFTPIDFISRQDVAFIMEDGNYGTIKGYHNFMAGFSVDNVASAYGWTRKGNGLFEVSSLECIDSDGNEIVYSGEIVIVGLQARLNAGAYHPVFNSLGCIRKYYDDTYNVKWYEIGADSVDNTSTYMTINEINRMVGHNRENSSTVNNPDYTGRPDSKLIDKMYLSGDGGLIFRNTLALKPNLHDLLSKKESDIVGVSEMAEESGSVVVNTEGYSGNRLYVYNASSVLIYMPKLGNLFNSFKIGQRISGWYSDESGLTMLYGTVTGFHSLSAGLFIDLDIPNSLSTGYHTSKECFIHKLHPQLTTQGA